MSDPCDKCGSTSSQHEWVEGDCVLPHRSHSRALSSNSFACEACVERHKTWLVEIRELWGSLEDVLLPGSVPSDGQEPKRQKRPLESPALLRLTAWSLLKGKLNSHVVDDNGNVQEAYLGNFLPDIGKLLPGWARYVYEELYQNAEIPVGVEAAIAALSAGAFVLASSRRVDEYDAELKWIRRSLMAAHGMSQPKALGECISSGCEGTVWPVVGNKPTCNKCRRTYGIPDIVRLDQKNRAKK